MDSGNELQWDEAVFFFEDQVLRGKSTMVAKSSDELRSDDDEEEDKGEAKGLDEGIVNAAEVYATTVHADLAKEHAEAYGILFEKAAEEITKECKLAGPWDELIEEVKMREAALEEARVGQS